MDKYVTGLKKKLIKQRKPAQVKEIYIAGLQLLKIVILNIENIIRCTYHWYLHVRLLMAKNDQCVCFVRIFWPQAA